MSCKAAPHALHPMLCWLSLSLRCFTMNAVYWATMPSGGHRSNDYLILIHSHWQMLETTRRGNVMKQKCLHVGYPQNQVVECESTIMNSWLLFATLIKACYGIHPIHPLTICSKLNSTLIRQWVIIDFYWGGLLIRRAIYTTLWQIDNLLSPPKFLNLLCI